ncbi:hypothetical protein PLICRDRAFT_40741 [Plicaturopsis crispa FD-325 SS-3]|nr:hypothetical protein PLICRDRAFT_40741 [Plicaturopsis crispa FD-325 SS-3]
MRVYASTRALTSHTHNSAVQIPTSSHILLLAYPQHPRSLAHLSHRCAPMRRRSAAARRGPSTSPCTSPPARVSPSPRVLPPPRTLSLHTHDSAVHLPIFPPISASVVRPHVVHPRLHGVAHLRQRRATSSRIPTSAHTLLAHP